MTHHPTQDQRCRLGSLALRVKRLEQEADATARRWRKVNTQKRAALKRARKGKANER